jgi:hypothetical protein
MAFVYCFSAVSGYGSKNLCSAVYLQHRNLSMLLEKIWELFLCHSEHLRVNEKDSSVTGSVWGLQKEKQFIAKGLAVRSLMILLKKK